MRVYKYWAQGHALDSRQMDIRVWRGSNTSMQDAQDVANQAAAKIAASLNQPRPAGDPADYLYSARNRPEQWISSFPASDGSPLAVVTRNRYGALVLNTADTVFIDADFSEVPTPKKHEQHAPPQPTGGGLLSWLFGNAPPAPPPIPKPAPAPSPSPGRSAADQRFQQIRETAQRYPALSFRVYRTHSGFRILLTDRRLLPSDPLVAELLNAFDSDPNYRNLCRAQQCFRARLTPKPANIDCRFPPFTYPYSDSVRDSAEQWEQEYENRSQGFRVCQWVADFGPRQIDPDVQYLMEVHDQSCRVSADLPLA